MGQTSLPAAPLRPPRSGLHPITWVVWMGIATAIALSTRNPMYLSLLLGVAVIHYTSVSSRGMGMPRTHRSDAEGWRMLLRIALGMTLLIIPFNALNVHVGRHVLFRLPSTWPIIGGAITLEAVTWGACSALSLMTLIVVFATFNLQINQAQMLRMTPAFIYEAGLIVSIALTFIPQMMISAREIREAQLIRGHRMRGVRDMLPFLMALLTTGLERSFQLAESMEARGFGNVRARHRRSDLLYKGLTLLGLAGFLCGFFAAENPFGMTYFESLELPGWIGVTLSTVLLIGVFWAQGKRVLRTHYVRDRWTWRDGIVIAAGLAVVLTVILVRMQDADVLVYDPYNELLPRFHPWVGVALAALVVQPLVALVLLHPACELDLRANKFAMRNDDRI